MDPGGVQQAPQCDVYWEQIDGYRYGEVVQFAKRLRIYSAAIGGKDVLSTSRRSKGPASAVSMKGKSSSTRKSRTRAKRRQKTSRFSADFGWAPANQAPWPRCVCEYRGFAKAPSAQERNNVSTDVVLTKELKRLVRRRGSFVTKCVDALLPCCHSCPGLTAVASVSTR